MEKLSDKEWLALRRYSTAPLSEVWRDAIDIVLAQRPVSYTAEDALVEALENIIDGNDLACERKQTLESWPDSHFRKMGRAALKLAKEGRNG